jgi:hypothetical protein
VAPPCPDGCLPPVRHQRPGEPAGRLTSGCPHHRHRLRPAAHRPGPLPLRQDRIAAPQEAPPMALISQPGSDYQIAAISLDAGYARDLILMLTDVHAVLDHHLPRRHPAPDHRPGPGLPAPIRQPLHPARPHRRARRGHRPAQPRRTPSTRQHPARPARTRTSRQQPCRQPLTLRNPAHRTRPDQTRTPTPAPPNTEPNKRQTAGSVRSTRGQPRAASKDRLDKHRSIVMHRMSAPPALQGLTPGGRNRLGIGEGFPPGEVPF